MACLCAHLRTQEEVEKAAECSGPGEREEATVV